MVPLLLPLQLIAPVTRPAWAFANCHMGCGSLLGGNHARLGAERERRAPPSPLEASRRPSELSHGPISTTRVSGNVVFGACRHLCAGGDDPAMVCAARVSPLRGTRNPETLAFFEPQIWPKRPGMGRSSS
jgi:hypothetical protein